MDTLNTLNIDRSTSSIAMGTSDKHSEKTSAASDEEDFKLNIPYFEDINGNENIYNKTSQQQQFQEQQIQQQSTRGNFDLLNQNQSTSPDIDDPNQMNYTNWDNDDVFTDDNGSRFGSEYSAQSTSESPNLYPPQTGAQYYYGDQNEIDIKYPPSEMILQPLRISSLKFEMQQQQQQPHQQQHQQQQQQHQLQEEQEQSTRRHLQPLSPPHLQHIPPALQHRHQEHHPYHHPQYGGTCTGGTNVIGPPYQQSNQPQQLGYQHHPNMWYPNAPYGSSRFNNYDPNRYVYHCNNVYGHDPMIDMLQLSNNGREARNRAEKNRRDKLNGSIQELSTMVPHVAESPRRVDKTAVLRFAAHGLRLKYVFGEAIQHRSQITDPLMKLLDSFFITLTCHGQIVLISSSIEQHLGHCQADLYGQNILHITHPDDHSLLKHQLIPTDLENLFEIQPEDESGESRSRTEEEEQCIDKKLREDKRSFTVRLARAGPRSEPTTYEVVRIEGCFRRSDEAPRGIKHNPFPTSLQIIRRSRGRDDSIPLHAISGNDIVLIAIARIIRPPRIVNRNMECNSLEYKTRHLIDGRIIDCDQRIGLVAGYMTDEVKNLSPFSFMHQDDARWVIVALRQMYDCNSSYGESTYRLLSRNGTFIYLQSRGYLEIDKSTNKVHSFVCINTLLNEEEGKRRVEEMKRKFSIIINARIPSSSFDAPASDNPQQLEKAVMRLIQDLQKSSDEEENYENEYECRGTNSQLVGLQNALNNSKAGSNSPSSSRKPTIALIPPEVSTVKSSISKSASVVNATAARQLRSGQRLRSPASTTEDEDDHDHDSEDIIGTPIYDINPGASKKSSNCTCGNVYNSDGFCETCGRYDFSQQTPTNRMNRKHKISESISSDPDDEPQHKRRIINDDIEQILSSPNQPEGSEQLELIGQNKHLECFNSQLQLIDDSDQPQNDILSKVETNYEVLIPSRSNIDPRTTKSSNQPTINKSEQKQR